MPSLKAVAIRPEFRGVFGNLKLLDFIAVSPMGQGQPSLGSWTSVSDILDELWTYWTGSDSQRFGRAALLQKLADQEGRGLANRIPVTELDQSESQMLGELESRRIVRIEDERVGFAHDLIGDLARLRTLIGTDSVRQTLADRSALPRWHPR